RSEYRISMADRYAVGEMVKIADPATGDDRHRNSIRHRARKLQIETGFGAVAIHAGEQNLASTQLRDSLCPFDRIQPGIVATAMREHVPLARSNGLGVNRHNDALAADLARSIGDELRVVHRRSIDTDFVRTGIEQTAHIVDAAHAATDGERDEHLIGDFLDDM